MSTPTSADPGPVLPDFGGACLTEVVRPLRQLVDRRQALPSWMPEGITEARQVVLLVVDGLGWEQLAERPGRAPTLDSAAKVALTSVAPSTTAAALTSLTTGLAPAAHGVVGYRLQHDGEVLNVLAWRLGRRDARQSLPPATLQPNPTFPGDGPTPVVSRAEYAQTGFTAAHLGSAALHGWSTPSGLTVEVSRLVAAGAPFVYAYYDGIDRVAHARGLGEHYDAELAFVDRLVGDLLEALGSGVALVVTADHGQVDVGPSVEVLGPELMEGVTLVSGEGRFRWLHLRPGAAEDAAAAATDLYGHLAWVRTRQQMIEEGWLGGEPVPAVADRLGDVALVPFEPIAFLDPADTLELRLVARHGSLTAAEMLVPLLAWPERL